MNYTNESIREIAEIEKITLDRSECNIERWLDIAFKLDYITLKEKDAVVMLLRRLHESRITKTEVSFCKTNYNVLKRMREITGNTIIPKELILRVIG
jgi:predicted YcjX-like family ATPase